MIRVLLAILALMLLLLRASAQDQQAIYLPLVSNNNTGPQAWLSYLPSVSVVLSAPYGYCGTAHGAPVECQECPEGYYVFCYPVLVR